MYDLTGSASLVWNNYIYRVTIPSIGYTEDVRAHFWFDEDNNVVEQSIYSATLYPLSPSTTYAINIRLYVASYEPNCVNPTRIYNTQQYGDPLYGSATTSSDDGGNGGGGCPYAVSWDGEKYIPENNILPNGEDLNRNMLDVEDYYLLENAVFKENGEYNSLQIQEFDYDHTYLDQAKLYVIQYPMGYEVAVDSKGEYLTYKDPSTPLSAIDSDGNDVLPLLQDKDDCRYALGYDGYYVDIDFGAVSGDNAKLIMNADAYHKQSIHVLILTKTGNWREVDAIHPRVNWAIEITDLSDCLDDIGNSLQVRLYWTDNHKMDWVALDTTPNKEVKEYELDLISAGHSHIGNILNDVLKEDGNYANIMPHESITLTFAFDKTLQGCKRFMLYTVGHIEKAN